LNPSKTDLDPRILGQLLAAQSVFSVFSSRLKMGEFVCRAVEGVPGVASCAVCMPGEERPRLGGGPVPECADCDVPEGDMAHDPNHPCLLSSGVGIQTVPLKTLDRNFGYLLLKLGERERYAPYEPFVSNLANGLAVNIDRQWQKEGLEAANVELGRHREQLEELVRERTAGLTAANEELRISEEELASQLEELQQSRDALRESGEKYRLLSEFTWDWIYWLENDYRFVYCSPSCERITGYAAEEFLRDPDLLVGIVHPEDRALMAEHRKVLHSSAEHGEMEFRIVRRDGEVRWIGHVCKPIVTADGGSLGRRSGNRDITESKRAEEALQQKQELLAQAEKIGKVGGWEFNIDTMQQTWTDMVYAIHELDATNRPTVDQGINYYTPASRPIIERAVQRAIEQGEPFDVELEIITAKGNLRSVHAIGKADPARRKISGFFQDITERKRAEEALTLNFQRTQVLLQLNKMTEATLQEITNFTLEESVRLTQSKIGYLAFLNQDESVLTMHSWSKTAMAECAIIEKPIIYPVASTGLWGEAVRQRRPVITNDYAAANPLKKGCPQGHVVVKRHMNVPVFEGSRIVIVAGVGNKDKEYNQSDAELLILLMEGMWRLLERKRAEESLGRAVADLKRSNEELQQFAYVASHDLQEPLRAVASFTQLLSERYKGKLDKDADEFIAFAVGGANRMQTLINDLLSYSRLETRGKPPEPTDSHDALGRALANLGTAIRESGALVTNDDLPMVKADEGQLVQLFQNLIGNAIKFRGQEPPRVHISAVSKGNEWLFSVRDNGIGIAQEYQERIFTIFQRLHSREEYPGTGIGLALCKRIVERQGGTIRVESEPGSGSTFLFTLPKP